MFILPLQLYFQKKRVEQGMLREEELGVKKRK